MANSQEHYSENEYSALNHLADMRDRQHIGNATHSEQEFDDAMCDAVNSAMKRRLAQGRIEGRYGWWDEGTITEAQLQGQMHNHLRKGSLLSAINVASMLYMRKTWSSKWKNTLTQSEELQTMSEFKQYKRKGLSEMRPYVKGEDLSGVSVSEGDYPIEDMGMIARNPQNHKDQWYVAKKYFEENLELAE